MKYLFLILILFGCKTKTKDEKINLRPPVSPIQISSLSTWDNYSKDIDIMVAFLWPEEVKVQDRPLLNEIIQTSRSLKKQKEDFLKTSHQLKNEFDTNFCNCVLNFECTGEEDIQDENICYDIEENIYANDRLLIDIYGLVELIKTNVNAIGGKWLDTHLDHRNLPNSQIDFSKMELSFSAFDAGNLPYSYSNLKYSLVQLPDFNQVELQFKRMHESNEEFGNWKIQAAAIASEYSLLFQGKLFWEFENKSYEGMIYWEHPRTKWD